MKILVTIVTGLVLIHHGVAYHHGNQHIALAIEMAAWQNLFINVVILIFPLLGAALLWTRWRRAGSYAVLLGMTGALIFGIAHHYMLISPDHISHLPSGDDIVQGRFIWTAGAIAILEGLTAAAAAALVGIGIYHRELS